MTRTDPQSRKLTPAHFDAGWWVCPCQAYNSPDDVKCWQCETERDADV